MPDTTINALGQYGWYVIITYLVIKESLPVLVKWFTGSKNAEAQLKIDTAKSETLHKRELENRQIKAIETIAENTDSTRVLIETLRSLVDSMNQRLESHERDTAAILTGIEVLLDRKARAKLHTRQSSASSEGPEA